MNTYKVVITDRISHNSHNCIITALTKPNALKNAISLNQIDAQKNQISKRYIITINQI
jgi:hypothetical protein